MVNRVEPSTFQKTEEGEVKFATARVEVPADGTEQFVIQSPPSGADVKGDVINLSFRTGAAFTVDYRTDFSIDSNGTPMNVANAKTAGEDSSELLLEYGGSYSGMDTVAESYIPGSTENKGAGTSVENIELIVSNDTELMLEVVNQNSSSAAYMSVVLVFAEEELQ